MLPFLYNTVVTATTVLSFITSIQGAATSEGCYKDDSSLTSQGTYAYQSEGYCSTLCSASNFAVFAMSDGNVCSCGNSLPSGGSVSSSLCNLACSGYPSDICGGTDYYSVWLTGVGTLSGGSGSGSSSGTTAGTTLTSARRTTTSSSTSTSTTQAPSVIYVTTAVVQQGVTVIQTVSATTRAAAAASASSSASARTSSAAESSGGGGISGGAIAGIVIGVLALAAIGAIVAFFLLRQRRRKSEEFAGEYKRQIEPAGAGYVHAQPPSPDNRLDTSLAIRRNSSESLADNQDYSRKILRVVN